MFSRWGEFAYQHRRVIPLVVVAVIILLYLTFGMRLSDRMSQEGWDDPNSDSTTAAAIEARTFGRDNNGDVILLFTAETGTIDESPEFGHIQEYLTNLLAGHPDQIDHITSYFDKRVDRLISQDKRTAFAAIALKGDGDQTLKDFRAIEAQLAGAGRMFPGVSTQIAGATAVADALDEGMSRDISRAEFYALPAVALLLLVVFGSLVAACMPLIVGGLSIVGSLGVLSILAGFTQVNVFAHSVVTLLGLGLAIDYGLFMVSRFREELNRGGGQDVHTAVRRATGTAGKTVVFSAAMVAVALSGLLVFPQAFLKSVAYGAISAVGLAAVLSVTMLPALFSLLGHNIDKFMVRRPRWAGVTGVVAHALGRGKQAGRRSTRGRGYSRSHSRSRAAAAAASKGSKRLSETWWYRLPNWSMGHAVWVTCAIVGGLLLLALPIGGVEFGGINETYLPPTNEVRAAQSTFDREFPEFRTEPIKLVVTNADNDQLVQVYQQAEQVEGLTGRFTPTSATKDGITVLSAGIVDRAHNQSVVDQLRAIEPPAGVKVYVGGTPALEIESIEALFDKLPLMSFYIVLATFVLMALVFGSLVLPAKAVIMTLLGMGATIGLLTWMFVDGVGANLFGFTPGPLMSPVLVLIMAIIYGLSTDYEVFLVSRMVEARERRAATDVAIKFGTAHTGGIISAAAIIMIVVCGAFGFSDIVMMKYIAFGMIFALLFDATIIRMMLVPAVMHLLQDDNWWAPPWVKSAAGALGHRVSRNQGPGQSRNQGRGRGQAGLPKRAPRPQPQPSQATRPRRLARSAQQGQPARPVRRPRTNIPKQDSRASVRIERDRASSSKQPSNQHPRREETIELATGSLPPQRFDKPRTTNPSTHRHFSPTTGRNTKQVPFTELLKRLESED
ncbi:Transmembrane transport protein MmpL [Corynebacterium matruchotii]|uniref:MMPL family transporter n=1 Tax=Corynebacterium matruchotii TaxID=43768 RepID=UPI000F6E434D|nr:MMPL family transporter [Corynebacterium matruchotii]VEI98817.1 Transmembrane transport protein MmpL [Corynebacterium matruchotii]